MRRTAIALLSAMAFAGPALASPTLEELRQDQTKKREIDKGSKILEKYFKAEADLKKSRRPNPKALNEAQTEFLDWLDATPEKLGTDLRAHAAIIIDMIDEARVKQLERRYRRESIEYVKVDDAKGMKRHEYAILVPPGYGPDKAKVPLIVSLHGRVINPRHPAFRSAPFEERARHDIWNNWYKTPAAEHVLVVAPTTSPDGFQFGDNHYDDLQTLYRTIGEALTDYRADWDRIFLEVHGKAVRVALEQSLVFAGIILRDRVDDRKEPPIPADQFFLLENLNGVPFVYVADAEHWANVGKPLSDALTAAYAAAGKPENLVVIQAQRDVDNALRGGEDKIKEFVTKHVRPRARESFTWRFYRPEQVQPFPVLGMEANFNFDVNEAAKKAPLGEKAGRFVFKVRREAVDGKDINKIEIEATEAEGLNLALFDPLVDLDLPVTVVVNGTTLVEAKKFERDWQGFFDITLPRRFFMVPVLATVDVTFPLKPQFVSPEEAKPAEEGKPAEEKPAEGSTPAGGSAPASGDADQKKAAGR